MTRLGHTSPGLYVVEGSPQEAPIGIAVGIIPGLNPPWAEISRAICVEIPECGCGCPPHQVAGHCYPFLAAGTLIPIKDTVCQ